MNSTSSARKGTVRRLGQIQKRTACVIVVSMLSLNACSSSSDDKSTDAVAETSASATEATAVAVESTVSEPVETAVVASPESSSTTLIQASTSPMPALTVQSAEAYLSSLDDAQRASTMFDFDDLAGKQISWSNFPAGAFNGRRGVPLGELTATQRAAALATVDAVLSDQGYEQVVAILAADDVAGAAQGSGGGAKFGSDYFSLAFYGTPSVDTPWTVQFGGHHLVVHVTVGGGKISISPAFTGAEPMTFTWDGKNYAPMAGEQDAVFGLLDSLTPAQLDAAKINGVAEMVVGPGHDTGFPAPEGLLVGDLAPASQDLVRKVIAQWVSDADPTVTSELLATYESQLAETRIAWSGSTSPDGLNSYFRVDGPRIWIEYTNTSGRGSTVAHAHTVYRDRTLDYGTGPS